MQSIVSGMCASPFQPNDCWLGDVIGSLCYIFEDELLINPNRKKKVS